MQTHQRQPQSTPALTPADEAQNVADYQRGWNDSQCGRPFESDAPFHYAAGYVDAAFARSLQ